MTRRMVGRVLALTALAIGRMLPASAQETAPDYLDMLRELRPRMVFDITADSINTYLARHPTQFALPDGFADPHLVLDDGLVEVSARTRVLFVSTRVSVGLAPEISRGRLRLAVRRIRASGIPLPSQFHRGVADGFTGVINEVLERNGLDLTAIAVDNGVVRVTADMRPLPAANAP